MKLKLYRSSCEKCKEKGSETGISTDAIHLEETRSEFPTVLCYIESTGNTKNNFYDRQILVNISQHILTGRSQIV